MLIACSLDDACLLAEWLIAFGRLEGWSAGVTTSLSTRGDLLHGFLACCLSLACLMFALLWELLVSHWSESEERTHRDSREVVVEIPNPLRSDNLLTCLMSLIWAFIAIVTINSWLSGHSLSVLSWGHFLAASHCEAIRRICLALIPSCDYWLGSPDKTEVDWWPFGRST
jgi:hypothetical protein